MGGNCREIRQSVMAIIADRSFPSTGALLYRRVIRYILLVFCFLVSCMTKVKVRSSKRWMINFGYAVSESDYVYE
ncbi:hypothetical protein Dimus_034148 [Dionaea muscipula]